MAAPDALFFGDKFLPMECTLEAETSVSNLTQYKLFISDDIKIRFLEQPSPLSNMNHCLIAHVRNTNILTWLRGFLVKVVNILSFFCLSIPKRDLDTKITTPNMEVCPESLGAMSEY